jgi:hypothetical protein
MRVRYNVSGDEFGGSPKYLWGPITRVIVGGSSTFAATFCCGYEGFTESGEPTGEFVAQNFPTSDFTLLENEIFRLGGEPDNCGNPPVPVNPNPNPRPDPGLDPGEEPFTDPDGRTYLPMPPITDPFGDPIELPNIPLPEFGNPSLYPKDEPDRAPAGGEPEEPGDKGDPDAPVDTGPGGEEEAVDEDRWLMGVSIEVMESPSRASGFQTAAGFVYTAAGFVYMGAGQPLEYYEESERMLDGGQYFPAKKGYDTWRVVANPFYNLRITPYYKDKEE